MPGGSRLVREGGHGTLGTMDGGLMRVDSRGLALAFGAATGVLVGRWGVAPQDTRCLARLLLLVSLLRPGIATVVGTRAASVALFLSGAAQKSVPCC